MQNFYEYLGTVDPGFVAEAKEEKEKCDDKGGDGPGLFAKFSKKKEDGGEEKGDDSGKPEFPANFLKKSKKK